MKSRELVLKKSHDIFFTFGLIATMIFTGISLLGIIVKTGVLFYGMTIVFSILTVLFGGLKFLFVWLLSHITQSKEEYTCPNNYPKLKPHGIFN